MRAEGLGGGVRLVTHRRQRFHWDCGVACVLMCLPGTRQVSEDEWRRQEFGRRCELLKQKSESQRRI